MRSARPCTSSPTRRAWPVPRTSCPTGPKARAEEGVQAEGEPSGVTRDGGQRQRRRPARRARAAPRSRRSGYQVAVSTHAGAQLRLPPELGLLPPRLGRTRQPTWARSWAMPQAEVAAARRSPTPATSWSWWASRSTARRAIAPPKQRAAGRPARRHHRRRPGLSRLFPAARSGRQVPGALPDGAAGRLRSSTSTRRASRCGSYNIKEAGKAGTRCTPYSRCRTPPGAYWGIEETRFTDAPILANPDADAQARRPHVPLLLQRRAHPHDRLSSGRHRLLGAEHLA